ncbi:hypothetical protein AYJ54_13995 [Bradyrhizobium centrolobii]|uniref:Uncharacterized protein n=1 Tax=Bradyrhizobium centrolobii TaxID=1505087 RepID=A0A176YNI0_9BRAD|nr:hypothetical protein AYJ54_13995 [Bradyrhizobium centrolobii]
MEHLFALSLVVLSREHVKDQKARVFGADARVLHSRCCGGAPEPQLEGQIGVTGAAARLPTASSGCS